MVDEFIKIPAECRTVTLIKKRRVFLTILLFLSFDRNPSIERILVKCFYHRPTYVAVLNVTLKGGQ